MTSSPRARPEDRTSPPPTAGLRLRLWLGCLGGALAAAGGIWWVIGAYAGPGAQLDLPLLVSSLWATAALGLLVGIALALWIDHGVIGHLRGLVGSLTSGRVAELRGLPATAGWGELSQLTQALQSLLTHHRQAARAAEELGLVRDQVAAIREALDRWADAERWTGPPQLPGPLAPVLETLGRGLRRGETLRDQSLQAALKIGGDVGGALDDARETAGEAERGFVEATALLTTVRELQRLTGDLGQSLDAPAAASGVDPSSLLVEYRRAARAAIEELVQSSAASVEHLSRGLLRVQEIADQVHLVANRATLIALNAALSTTRQGRPESDDSLSEEMKRLANEVRAATDRTTRWSLEVEGEIAAASERMKGVRARVAERMEAVPTAEATSESVRAPESARLLERVREMVQDATQKGERLSAAGERVSRSAERLVRRLEEDVQELAGMVTRLSSPGVTRRPAEIEPPAAQASEPEDTRPAAPPEGGTRAPGLRLLGEEHLLPGEPPAGEWRAGRQPGAGDRGGSK
jgi:hypothetical protein